MVHVKVKTMEWKKGLILGCCCLFLSVFCNKVNVIVDDSGTISLGYLADETSELRKGNMMFRDAIDIETALKGVKGSDFPSVKQRECKIFVS